MIIGSVGENGDSVVPIRVFGSNSLQVEVDCIVDTGFNEDITLPPDLIEAMQLSFISSSTFTLADGSKGFANVFDAMVQWFGQPRRVMVLELDGAPLIGMTILHGSRLTIDIVPNGRVLIELLTSTP